MGILSVIYVEDTCDAALTYQSLVRPESSNKFIYPKLFRRYRPWWAYRQVRSFDTFLALPKNDAFYELTDLVNGGVFTATPPPLEKMVRTGKTIQYDPDEVAFKESVSRLYTPDGTVIDHW